MLRGKNLCIGLDLIYFKILRFIEHNAPVICNHGSPPQGGVGDSGVKVQGKDFPIVPAVGGISGSVISLKRRVITG